MVFTDLSFLFGFLPLSVLCYRFFKRSKFANLYILIASLLFYAWGGLRSLAVLVLLLLWNYLWAKMIAAQPDSQKRKSRLILAVSGNLFVLFMYRYFGVWFGRLIPGAADLVMQMPLGLSFYVFSCLSCLFDVYRNAAPAPASFVDFGVYAAFFGRVNMGPVAHYAHFEEQLHSHPLSRKKNFEGMTLFMQGLFRKVILADSFALLYGALAGNPTWLGSLIFGFSYFFRLYYDFSGYSRMARGIGRLFGFTIDPNFSLPYTAVSVQDFWRRWHISLTSWFRDYIYIPLGGNRVSHPKWIANILIVWLLTGLWHGATLPFLVWGLYQGGLILLEHASLGKVLDRLPKAVQHIYLILTQLLGWTIFSSASLMDAIRLIGRYIGIGAAGFADAGAIFYLLNYAVLFLIAILLASGYSIRLAGWIRPKLSARNYWILSTAGWICVFLMAVSFLVSATSQTFLYAAF